MPDDMPSNAELEEHFRKLAPPNVPADSFVREIPSLFALRRWRRDHAAALIGGLLTLPALHANGIRLDWLLRMVTSFADGRKSPTRHDLDTALNAGLSQANVASQEDPSEELF